MLVSLLFALAACGEAEEPEPERHSGWLSSDGALLQLYHGEETVTKNIFGKVTSRTLDLTEDIKVPRGTEVILIDKPETDDEGNVTYEKLAILTGETGDDGKPVEEIYYIVPGSFVDDYSKIITETEKFVRTSATVYTSPDDPGIAGWARKGTRVEITGFDR